MRLEPETKAAADNCRWIVIVDALAIVPVDLIDALATTDASIFENSSAMVDNVALFILWRLEWHLMAEFSVATFATAFACVPPSAITQDTGHFYCRSRQSQATGMCETTENFQLLFLPLRDLVADSSERFSGVAAGLAP